MTRAVQYDGFGGIDLLQVRETVLPSPAPGEVLIDVKAAGINPGEAAIREGYLNEMAPSTFPSGQGTDLAGIVAAIGDDVTEWSVGDEVIGWSERRSSQAAQVLVPADQLVAKPATIPWEVAGGLFVVAVTAFAAVRAVGAGPGDTVLISAAAGGVGAVAVQLAQHRGAQVVGIASEDNHAWLRELGALPVAYGDGLAGRIRELAPQGISAVIDCFGPEYVDLAVELGVSPDRIDTIISFEAAGKAGAKAEGSAAASTPEALGEMVALVADGTITVAVAATYPLERVQDAYTELEKRHTRGKIVLIP